jgi:hypothetical protein
MRALLPPPKKEPIRDVCRCGGSLQRGQRVSRRAKAGCRVLRARCRACSRAAGPTCGAAARGGVEPPAPRAQSGRSGAAVAQQQPRCGQRPARPACATQPPPERGARGGASSCARRGCEKNVWSTQLCQAGPSLACVARRAPPALLTYDRQRVQQAALLHGLQRRRHARGRRSAVALRRRSSSR